VIFKKNNNKYTLIMTDNEFQEVSYKKQRELTFAEKAKFIKLNIKKGDTIIKNNWIILHDLNGQIKYKPVNLGEKGFWNTNINNAYKYFTDEEIKIKTKEDFINSEKDKNINNIEYILIKVKNMKGYYRIDINKTNKHKIIFNKKSYKINFEIPIAEIKEPILWPSVESPTFFKKEYIPYEETEEDKIIKLEETLKKLRLLKKKDINRLIKASMSLSANQKEIIKYRIDKNNKIIGKINKKINEFNQVSEEIFMKNVLDANEKIKDYIYNEAPDTIFEIGEEKNIALISLETLDNYIFRSKKEKFNTDLLSKEDKTILDNITDMVNLLEKFKSAYGF
jgi:hypothetical protein